MSEVKIGDEVLIRVRVIEIADTAKGTIYRGKAILDTDSKFYTLEIMPKDIIE